MAASGIGLTVSVTGWLPLTQTPPISRWWLYLFILGMTAIVWGAAILIASRTRYRRIPILFAAFSTAWGVFVAVGLGRAPIYKLMIG
jgi:hypothetical protein